VAKLPTDLVAECLWLVGRGQPCRVGGIRHGTQGVRTHMSDGRGLPRRSSGSHGCRGAHLASSRATDEATADLRYDLEFPACEGARPGDRVTGSAIPRSFSLEDF
jgi:hypothetical protein